MSKPRYLIASDFDGTLFDTSKPSPSGTTVETAYVQSLNDLFGEGIGERFFSINGFHGESPSQIIQSLLATGNERLINNAKRVHQEQNGNFSRVIPESQDGTVGWNNESPQITLASMLIIGKLGYLLQEIGTLDKDGKPWPLPCEGALDFLRVLESLKGKGVPIDLAIISSGHESFIKKALKIWNISPPDILITEDHVRLRRFPKEPETRFKPGVFPIALAHFQWLKDQRIPISRETGSDTRTRIMHIGDVQTKDIVMAERAGIRSNHLFPRTSWKSITETLIANRNLLDGRPIEEILKFQAVGVESLVGGRLERR